MGKRRPYLVGRAGQIEALAAAVPPPGRPGRIVLVRGGAGAGKSALLAVAADRWRLGGARLVTVEPGHGCDGVTGAVRARIELFDDVAPAVVLDGIRRLERAGALVAAVSALADLFDRLAARRSVVVVVDGARADDVPALVAAARQGCLVVAACRPDDPAAAALTAIAHSVLDLPPLTDAQLAGLLARHGARADEGVLIRLRTALGTLGGNPGTVVELIDRAAYGADGDPIALAAEHPLVAAARAAGRPGVALTVIAAAAAVRVADLPGIARALRCDLAAVGASFDHLLEQGILDRVGEAARTGCPALAQALALAAGAADRALWHAAAAAIGAARREETAPAAPRQAGPDAARPSLSIMERRIVAQVRAGQTNRKIAAALRVSEKTVEASLTRLYKRTGYRSRVELAANLIASAAPGPAK